MTEPKPFLRWVGGKRRLTDKILSYLPEKIHDYREPFLGGGAVFFALRAQNRLTGLVLLSDANEELINAYVCVRDQPGLLMGALYVLSKQHCKEAYYEQRNVIPPKHLQVSRAARFIYLNRVSFNGMYRVNKAGKFNVPLDPKRKPMPDEKVIRAASAALQGVSLVCFDYHEPLTVNVTRQTSIYADPPYIPLKADTPSFTSYTSDGFDDEDQQLLATALRNARRDGATVVASNSGSPRTKIVYAGFEFEPVKMKRSINCKGHGRGEVQEYLIHG